MSYWKGLTYNGSLLTYGNNSLGYYPSAEMNPYNLPPWTIRIEYAHNQQGPIIPSLGHPQAHVDHFGNGNVWDVYLTDTQYPESSFRDLFRTNKDDTSIYTDIMWKLGDPNLLKVWGANAPGLRDIDGMFANCHNLREVCLFDTRHVKRWMSTFGGCDKLQYIPRFDVSSADYMTGTFVNCIHVTGGALDLYNDASSTGLVQYHYLTFGDCGRNTTTGAAELSEIPESWGGLKEN